MKVLNLDFYLDGGTAKVVTDEGIFFVDRRLKTDTPGFIYDKHPDEGGVLVSNVRSKLLKALRVYSNNPINDPIGGKDCIDSLISYMETASVKSRFINFV